jgi:hypothetical protein
MICTYINYNQRIDKIEHIPLQLVYPGFDKNEDHYSLETYAQNEFSQNHSRDLNRDELTLSYQPFNSSYECNFIKYATRSSKMFKN